jgi:hypothetical protein
MATDEEVTAVATKLNQLCDRMNVLIAAEEEYLHLMNLGVEGYIKTKSGYDLGYVRSGRKWKIKVKQETDDPKEPFVIWNLDSSPRGIRYSALQYLPALRDALVKQANSLANRIEKALQGEPNGQS